MGNNVEILDNEKRNAIPSWQGYHYQAKTAVLKILKYILSAYENKSENIENIYILIEYIEDFVIFHNNEIRELYQAKKTLTKEEYESVLTNFLFQYKIINTKECKWVIIYDADTSGKNEKISKEDFDKIQINLKGMQEELELLRQKDVSFWKSDLNLMNKQSTLKQTRGYIRKKMNLKNNKMFEKLNEEIQMEFIKEDLNELINLVNSEDDDFKGFVDAVVFEKKEISCLDIEIEKIIENLVEKNFIMTLNKYDYKKIREHLEAKVYIKLMHIKNKSEERLSVNYNDIKEIIEGKITTFHEFEKKLMVVNNQILKDIDDNCYECQKYKECKEGINLVSQCNIIKSLDLNYKEVIKNANLDFPKLSPETITSEMTETILSRDRKNHLVDVILDFKEYLSFNEKKNHISFDFSGKNLFVSQVLEKERRAQRYISENAREYLEIYNEYDEIFTPNYSGTICIDNQQLLSIDDDYLEENEINKPKFNDIAPIKCINSNMIYDYITSEKMERLITSKDINRGNRER